MQFALAIAAGFICFWSWSHLQHSVRKTSISQKWATTLCFLPWVLAAILSYINWSFIAMSALGFLALQRWIKFNKVENYFKIFFAFAVTIMGFEFFLQKLSLLIQTPEPELWVFWLGATDWKGILLGFLAGFLGHVLLREKGHTWWIAPALMVSGLGSLGLAWGLFLGDRWIFRSIYSSIFSLVGIGFGVFFMGQYVPQMKMVYWLIACLVWICAEILIFNRQAKK